VVYRLSIIGPTIINRYSEDQKLYRAVSSHVREYGESIITLAELTDFEWEQAVYFSKTANQIDIYEAVGVMYGGSMDLTRGIIFVNGGEIVYNEYFPWRGYGMSVHMYPVRLTMETKIPSDADVKVFEREDMFEVGVTLSENRSRRAQSFGDLYWMRFVE